MRNTRKSAAWVAVHERDRSSVVTRHCLGHIDDPGDKNDPRTILFPFRSAGWCGPTPLASDYRAHCLHDSLHQYNRHRLNASLEYQPPITRVPVDENNLVAL